MKFSIFKLKFKLDSVPRYKKNIIIFLHDTILAFFSLYMATVIRSEGLIKNEFVEDSMSYIVFIPLIIIFSGFIASIFKISNRNIDIYSLFNFFNYSILVAIVYSSIIFLSAKSAYPRSVIILFGLIFLITTVLSRLIFIKILTFFDKINKSKKIIIYGAGSAGVALFKSIQNDTSVVTKAFVDDNKHMQGLIISNIPVYSRSKILRLKNHKDFDEIWIALPTANNKEILEIITFCEKISSKVLKLPPIEQLLKKGDIGKLLLKDSLPNFLGRDNINIDYLLYKKQFTDKNILVSGAGGSIGSVICKQLSLVNPKTIIFFEISELNLYNIESFFQNNKNKINIVSILGSVCNEALLSKVIKKHQVQIIINAAAYKHVPMVEKNITEGYKNNVIGTKILSKLAVENEVEIFIQISSDKAVRPTNIMGVTKRIAELVVQNYAEINKSVNFSIVRFGNVLGSSGSVIPLFNKQIANGGPVTVTDVNMVRYFMSIEEASQLVLLSGTYGKNGDIYILDMGEPVKIIELARNMIKISGNTVKDENNPFGDIEIKITKKRPGEKLFEELIIDGIKFDTPHKKVTKVVEKRISKMELNNLLSTIDKKILFHEDEEIKAILKKNLNEYSPEKINFNKS